MILKEVIIMKKNELGFYFKTIRIYKGITKKKVCDYCGISVQYLTKIEDDLMYISLSKEFRNKLSDALNINFFSDYNFNKTFFNRLNEFIRKCIYSDENGAISIYLDYENKIDSLQQTICYPYFLLMKFVYLVLFERRYNNELVIIQETLDKVKNHFYGGYLQIFLLYLAVFYKNQNKLDSAFDILTKAKSIGNNEHILSMIYYHMSIIQIKKGEYFNSFLSNLKANNLFSNTNNYIRNVYALSHMGLIFLHMRDYAEAIKCCNEAIESAKIMNKENIMAINYQNLSWLGMLTKHYNEVKDNVMKALDYGRKDTILYFHVAYSYAKLNDYESSEAWVKKGMSVIENKKCIQYKLLKMVQGINKNKLNAEILLEEMVNYLELKSNQQHDTDLLYLLYQEIIECKKEKEKFIDAIRYYEILEKLRWK